MKLEDLKVGMTFINERRHHKIKITELNNKNVTILFYNYSEEKNTWLEGTHLEYKSSHLINYVTLNNYTLIEKPLDQAFKTLDKQLCTHKNIRTDQFFTAMVYKTCKDCGKPLN
jgi:hypothetical protein